jgi:hypothetical protein
MAMQLSPREVLTDVVIQMSILPNPIERALTIRLELDPVLHSEQHSGFLTNQVPNATTEITHHRVVRNQKAP